LNQGRSGKQTRKRSSGRFARLRGHVEAYTPEQVSEITWIPEDKIWQAARIYAETKPAALHHRVAIEHNVNATQTGRALTIPAALTGNIDLKGGSLLPMHMEGYIAISALAGGGKWLRPGPENGCSESNINVVMSGDPPRENMCGSVPTRGTLCKIYK